MVNRRILFILIATTQLTRVILGKERKVKRDRRKTARDIVCEREEEEEAEEEERREEKKRGGVTG
jgi:hypothetical protein